MTARQNRMILIGLVVTGVTVSAFLALRAFEENLLFFFSPAQVAAGEAPTDRTFRLGGMVLEDSINREIGSLTLNFIVTDYTASIPVSYTGVLPDLFAENQGVVARGTLDNQGGFIAEEILAKHDENYMPPEVAEALALSEESQTP
ncbi:MAG: cytochrome c maturation protein CcmE [Candidatus Rariloculaceae bacterium]|jgi:cytochrome c-type biogenesis protein CcmE|nr:cytochrome c maturation protein CcmE [Gammaproteobacteria bacterium]|tara:strand:+ start:2503 stop:2940 length:438 start_codon:yes stop_codon:yes gene_type:complete